MFEQEMLSAIDTCFMEQEEPAKSCLLFLRDYLLKMPDVDETWSYGMPTYRYRGKRFCYLWFHKQYKKPYVGFIDGNLMEHPELLAEKRSRMKIFLIDPEKDIPVKTLNGLLKQAKDVTKG